MKSFPALPISIRLLAVGIAAPATWAGAQAINSSPILTFRPAVEIAMPTLPGKVYQMQASENLQDWQNHGEPVFGTGSPILQPMSGGSSRFFRLQIVDSPEMGAAPWDLASTAIQLNEGSRTFRYEFQPNGQGVLLSTAPPRSFSWKWIRAGLDSGEAGLTLGDGVKQVIKLDYTAPLVGQFSRKTYQNSRLESTQAGVFGPAPSATSVLMPGSITGRTFAFCEAPGGNGLSIITVNSGLRLMDGTTTAFNGNWLVTGSTTARLIANFSATHGEDYRFTFTGPLTGNYVRQTFTEGVFRDEDAGSFCLTPAP